MKFGSFEKFCMTNGLTIFSINDLKILFNQYSAEYLRIKIYRWKERGYISNLKNGLYYFSEKNPDEFEIASRLIIPSYISLETALSHYSIIPDVSGAVASVTTKNTRNFEIKGVRYKYHHVKNVLFENYANLKNEIFIATPEKAVLDYFYFRKPERTDQFFERINIEAVKILDVKNLKKIGAKYPQLTRELINYFLHVITKRPA